MSSMLLSGLSIGTQTTVSEYTMRNEVCVHENVGPFRTKIFSVEVTTVLQSILRVGKTHSRALAARLLFEMWGNSALYSSVI
jgi:hypothetical protein